MDEVKETSESPQQGEPIPVNNVPTSSELGGVFRAEKSKKPINWTLWISVILGVIILAGGGYLAWAKYGDTIQTKLGIKEATPATTTNDTATDTDTGTDTTITDETADWKTYASTDYSYELKYPSGWTLKSGSDADAYGANSISITSPETAKVIADYQATNPRSAGTTAADVAITYYSTIKDTWGGLGGAKPTTLQEYVTNPSFSSPVTLTFAGASGYELIAPGDSTAYEIIVQKDSHIYAIKFYNHASKSELSPTENLIASTFKFTDPTADWKTYTSSSYGYSIKYPSDWSYDAATAPLVTFRSPTNSQAQSDLVIYYYATLQDADGNNPKTAKTFDDIVSVNNSRTGKTAIQLDGQTAYEVVNHGMVDNYEIVASRNNHVYSLIFSAETKSALSDSQSTMISTLQFTN